MKKYLLLAVAALMVGSVSAQKVYKKTNAPAKMSTTKVGANQFKTNQFGTVKMIPQLRENLSMMTISGEKIVKAENKKFTKTAAVSRRALAAAYDGTCGGSAGSQKWTMTPVTLTDQTEQEFPGFEDLLPPMFSGLDHTYVTYSINGTAILVPAQYLLTITLTSGDQYEVWITNFTASSVDGSIEMTLSESGELTMEAPYVAYVALPVGTETFSFDDMIDYFVYFQSIKYQDASTISAPAVSYTSEDAIFYSGITSDGYSFIHQHVLLPAYAPVSFTNLTTDNADAWSWKAYTLGYMEDATGEGEGSFFPDKEVASADTRDFAFTTEGGEQYVSPVLVGYYQGLASEPYTGFDDGVDKETGEINYAIAYGGADASYWVLSDNSAPIVSRADMKNGLAGIVEASASSRYSGLVFYQGKPATPFYFEGVNMMVYNFAKLADVVNLTCKIYKVERDETGVPSLGELVAESDLDQSSLTPSSWSNTAQLKWNNFKSVDETGTIFNLDYFFVDYDFAIVIDGWNNGTFSGLAIGDDGDANCTISNTSVIVASSGKESNLAYYGHAFIGFDGAAYGYLYTNDDTNMNIAVEGGQSSINVSPMLIGQDEEGNPVTRLFFESAITDTDLDEDYDEDGWPVWLGLDIVDHYAMDDDGDLTEANFDLVFSADALPESVEGRQAVITFFQEGALLTIKVSQGDVSGITATKASVKVSNAPAYNLAGQRVGKNYKGLVVKDGVKFLNK